MSVDVDETRNDIKALRFDHTHGFGRGDARRHAGNLTVLNCNVEDAIDVVLRIDNVSTANEKVVFLLREDRGRA